MDFSKVIKERRSVRKFSAKKPEIGKILKAIDSARLAPMAGNIYSPKFIIVNDKKKINKLAEFCQQDFVADAKTVVVVVSQDEKVKRSYGALAEKYARQQGGAAMENFLLSLVNEGLSSCWVGYFEEEGVKQLLDIPGKVVVEAIFPVGYEHETVKKRGDKKNKMEIEETVFYDAYDHKRIRDETRINIQNV